ncbi:ABC transporter permease [Arthrobacter pascens]|uniref:ABC transporter permease n=1 Tax=Arthrobacter pascens TaxID=1677 RepID=UPI00196A29AC|nr:ABC transporter permease [Arthrobacter pascens]MBN3496639.1 ABC transporter permease [Arthrobacter pascens]
MTDHAGTARRQPRNLAFIGTAFGLLGLGLVYLFLYLPLIVTALFSFNDSRIQTLPMVGPTLRWYQDLFQDPQMISAILYSLQVAFTAVLISIIAGTVFALTSHRVRIRGGKLLDLLLTSPLVAPGMVLGISFLAVFNYAKINTGFWTIVIGHTAFITPLVMFLVLQRLKVADPSLEQASFDLGAGRIATFWHVTLPGIRAALVAAALLGFTMSMDEIAVTFFLAGTEPTLPVYVWGLVRFGFTPEVNAAFTLIGGGSLTCIALAGMILWFNARKRGASLTSNLVEAAEEQDLARELGHAGTGPIPAPGAVEPATHR